jgi:hypothetical protein
LSILSNAYFTRYLENPHTDFMTFSNADSY